MVVLCEAGWFDSFAPGGLCKDRLAVSLRAAYNKFKTWRKKHKIDCSQQRFTPSRLNRTTQQHFPDLAGKAANCKVVCFWVAEEVASYVKQLEGIPDTPTAALQLARVVSLCCYQYCKFSHLIDTHPRLLSEAAALDIHNAGYLHLKAYGWLCKQSMRDNSFMWSIQPKHHLFTHCLDTMLKTRVNAGYYQLFAAESFVGRVARISSACHRSRCDDRTLSRYLILLKQQLDQLRKHLDAVHRQ
jgi:hypothetical protein